VDKIGELGLDIPLFLAQLVNFLILFVLLYFVGFKKILKMLDERSQRIKESVEQADLVKAEAGRAEEENKKKLEAAAKEGQEAISRAMRAGEDARQRAEESAKEDAAGIIVKARQDFEREKNAVIGELRDEFADLAIVAAEKVIEKSLDKESHRALIDKVLDDSEALKES
jgi:F-type H+-transporting ATPase subunit b